MLFTAQRHKTHIDLEDMNVFDEKNEVSRIVFFSFDYLSYNLHHAEEFSTTVLLAMDHKSNQLDSHCKSSLKNKNYISFIFR